MGCNILPIFACGKRVTRYYPVPNDGMDGLRNVFYIPRLSSILYDGKCHISYIDKPFRTREEMRCIIA